MLKELHIMKKFYFLFFLAAISFSLPKIPTAMAEPIDIGVFTAVTGRVDVLRNNTDSPNVVTENTPVYEHDIIRTKNNSKLEITFHDGSIIRMAPASRVSIDEYLLNDKKIRSSASIKLYRGKMRAIVSKNGKSGDFHIITPSATGTVKGTDIFAFYQLDTTGIIVKEGVIAINGISSPDKTIELKKGSFISIPLNTDPLVQRPVLDAELSMYEEETKPLFSSYGKKMGKDIIKITAKITYLSGQVTIIKNSSSIAQRVSLGDFLTEGDLIQTGKNSRVEITLENGNVLTLKENSEITIKKMEMEIKTGNYDNTFESNKGEIKALVEKLGKKSTFKIKTPTAVCGVRGTIMYLNINNTQTTAYYEGGNGYMENIISGTTQEIPQGQNSSSNSNGDINTPRETTNQDRMTMEETWESDSITREYNSEPQNQDGTAAGENMGQIPGQTNNNNSNTNNSENSPKLNITNDTTNIINTPIFTNPIFSTPAEDTNTSTPKEKINFTGAFGYVSSDTTNATSEFATTEYLPNNTSINFNQGSVIGNFYFNVTGIGGKWDGASSSGTKITGTYADTGGYALWGTKENQIYTLSDGGKIAPLIGGIIKHNNLYGKIFGLYLDTAGYAGTFSSYFSGTSDTSSFSASSNPILKFSSKYNTSIPLSDFSSYITEENIISSGSGYGEFSSGRSAIYCSEFGGETRKLVNTTATELNIYTPNFGIWTVTLSGIFYGETNNNWTLALGGNNSIGTNSWLGTINGQEWQNGILRGTFEGVSFDNAGDGSVKAGKIENGDFIGEYELATSGDSSWSAIGAGEWIDIETPLSESNLGFSMNELSTFVSIPITEAYSSMVTCASGNIQANMNTHFYSSTADTNQIWTGIINGTHSGIINNNWAITLTNNLGDNITLNGDKWENGVWHAIVSGNIPGQNITLNGESAGNYSTDGKLEGVAAGTWQTGQTITE
ncbi:FecR domain-containing protein [Candidatus Omnitrophus magneticus]|uniref:FecR domain-containing protein n=1 Tax=Candidatus Omnitrophus magneticus TaxID=1609969 RepID=A0A0F0CLX3_9BACT|nr:FecR domain-containing protein [Candidatus Omnitrophus magneticus]